MTGEAYLVELDLKDRERVITPIVLNQADIGTVFRFLITDRGRPVDLTMINKAIFVSISPDYSKPSGRVLHQGTPAQSGAYLEYTLTEKDLAPGQIVAFVRLYDGQNQAATTRFFSYLVVSDTVTEEQIRNEKTFDDFVTVLLEAQGLLEGIKDGAFVTYQDFEEQMNLKLDKTNFSAYEEKGSWTPTYTGRTTAGSPAFSSNTGSFVRIGKLVFVSVVTRFTDIGGMAGTLDIGGLPFTPYIRNKTAYLGSCEWRYVNLGTNAVSLAPRIASATAFTFEIMFSTSAFSGQLNASQMANNVELFYSIWYECI